MLYMTIYGHDSHLNDFCAKSYLISCQYYGRIVFVTKLVVLGNKLSSEPIPRRHIDSAPRVKFTNPINVT